MPVGGSLEKRGTQNPDSDKSNLDELGLKFHSNTPETSAVNYNHLFGAFSLLWMLLQASRDLVSQIRSAAEADAA